MLIGFSYGFYFLSTVQYGFSRTSSTVFFFQNRSIDRPILYILYLRRSAAKRPTRVFRKLHRLATIPRRLVFRMIYCIIYTTRRVMFRKSNKNESANILYITYYWNVCCDFFTSGFILCIIQRTHTCVSTSRCFIVQLNFSINPRVKYMYYTSEHTSRVPRLGFFLDQ